LLEPPHAEQRAAWAIAPDDTIAWVDSGFDELAAGYGLPGLPDEAVGRPLLDFVTGERPRELQRHLIARARRSPEPIRSQYRCDAPEMRRFGLLELDAQPGGGVIFTSVFTELEARPAQALLDPAFPRDDRHVRECAWCNRFDVGGWCEVEEAAGRYDGAVATLPRVDHALCDICEMLLMGNAA
jgi:hypothetical protein